MKYSEHIRRKPDSDFNMANELIGNSTTINGSHCTEYLPAECKFRVHTFSDTFIDQTVHFQTVKMTDSLYLWIGTSAEMGALAVAMCTKCGGVLVQRVEAVTPELPFSSSRWMLAAETKDSVPAVVNLLGSVGDLSSSTLAQRLAKKTNKQCFVSYNAPTDNAFLGLVEQRINQEMKDKPEKF